LHLIPIPAGGSITTYFGGGVQEYGLPTSEIPEISFGRQSGGS
jgi:hypothetical protein